MLFGGVNAVYCPGCRPRGGFSRRGTEQWAPSDDDFRESFTFTALVSLTSAQPCWVSPPRTGTNDQFDFLRVIVWLVTERALVAGDYLILDNARVHAADTKAYVQALLDYHGVKLRFLPAYSPELNPCELVFAEVKRRLRTEPRLFQSFWRETLRHFACITHRMVNSYYKHCLLAPLGR